MLALVASACTSGDNDEDANEAQPDVADLEPIIDPAAEEITGPQPIDCEQWRYEQVDTAAMPPDYAALLAEGSEDVFKYTSARSEGLADSPQNQCGQMGPATDLAWELTQGTPEVLIAVLDSGIEWRDPDAMADLRLGAYLNTGELPPPEGSDEHDANGDGLVDISDYEGDSRVEDLNRNDVIDPEDLILDPDFSDGTDDDENGYVDDISGWDFLYGDNNPLDEVSYGHGTGEARDSTAAPDGGGAFGTCPRCRHLPVRVSDSFIADSGRFAAGVVFAVDSGADVVQEALGALNNVPQAQQAIDVAYDNGIPVVASMADEQSRHPNLPAALAHTMPVNSIQSSADALPLLSENYFGLNGCTNHGAYTWVSVPSESCSSEATGLAAGMMGLIQSAAREAEVLPHPALGDVGEDDNVLSANEAYQIVQMTADDIDFSTPNEVDPADNFAAGGTGPTETTRFPTAEGWDQTHGYGRINAYEAVRAVMARSIPPEADLAGPRNLEVLPTSGELTVTGYVAALRADSYDYRVEWAVGAQPPGHPDEDKWTSVAEGSGETAPIDGELATVDLAEVAQALPGNGEGVPRNDDGTPDVDRYSVRIRVTVSDDVGRTAYAQRQVFVHDDPDLLEGFPLDVAGAGTSSPVFADLDGDGSDELVLATDDGSLHAYRPGGEELEGWPQRGVDAFYWPEESPAVAEYSLEQPASAFLVGAPAIADLDGDGDLEVAVTDYDGNIQVFEHDGTRREGWELVEDDGRLRSPAHTNPLFSEQGHQDELNRTKPGFASPPVAADLDADGDLELVAAALDRHVYAFHDDGSAVDGFPVLVVDPERVAGVDPVSHQVDFNDVPEAQIGGELIATPAVGDLDGDGRPEIVVGAQEEYVEPVNADPSVGLGDESGNSRVYAIRPDGTAVDDSAHLDTVHPHDHAYVQGWPVPVAMLLLDILPSIGDGVSAQAAIGDVDGDGEPEVVVASAVGPLYVLDGDGRSSFSPDRSGPLQAGAWVVDPEAMVAGFSGAAVADLDGDGVPDYTAPALGLARALDISLPDSQPNAYSYLVAYSGRAPETLAGWPQITSDMAFFVTPAVADIDADGSNDVIAGNGIYLLDAYSPDGTPVGDWPKLTGGWVVGTPGLGDWDGDGTAELAIVRRDGQLMVWQTDADASALAGWPRFGHDSRNTGNFEEDSEQ
ncbi:MAG: hypothetical protein EDR02_16285 [Actinobacteria bacterium]|nr:MAG: hypothetical protein EDR02_16285 [Actinomycetota bacterium]RIK03872.1 MAG: hypothetical protein DCC48_15280 [Acidobacteriota bacterium]